MWPSASRAHPSGRRCGGSLADARSAQTLRSVEERSVGKPSQTRRLLRHLEDDLSRAVFVHGLDHMTMEVAHVPPTVVPTRCFEKPAAVQKDLELSCHATPSHSGS